jgi:serine/threonine-protein kinase
MLPHEVTLVSLRDLLIGTPLTGSGDVKFYVRELIGEGGQGWVYKANYDEPDGMWVVVKVLRPDSVHKESLVRFRREAEVLRMIGAQATPTPNVVRFYDHGIVTLTLEHANETFELPFTVLEYVDGITLADVFERTPEHALPVPRARRLLRQVVRALETVHAHRVVHRDLKPSNILIMNQAGREVVKVTDFGLVKLVDLKLTQTASIAGATLGYAPPEQYEHGNQRVSERTDVFSMSAITFEAVAGRSAFPYAEGDNPLRVITRILSGPRPSLCYAPRIVSRELVGQHDLLEQLDVVLGKGLDPDPDKRQASCRAFWSEVEPVLRAAERRAVERGFLPADINGSVVGVSLAVTADGGSRPPLPGTAETTMDGPAALSPRVRRALPPVASASLQALSGALRGVTLRAALFGADGSVLAIGPAGVYRWAERAWSVLATPIGLDPALVRGMLRTPDGQIVLIGDGGLIATLEPQGHVVRWPLAINDISLTRAWMDGPGELIAVGQRVPQRTGVIVHVARGHEHRALVVDTATPLRDVARVPSGPLIVCGDGGALLHIRLPTQEPIAWERTGNLFAIAIRPDGGAAVVGSGGHALSLSSSLVAALEPVQTTRDLFALAIAADGSAWAAGAEGRVLRYNGSLWERVAPTVLVPSRLIAMGASTQTMLMLGEDGTIVEGR